MAHVNITAVPGSAVATNGTFTAAYPTGYTAASFTAYGHKIFCEGLMNLLKSDDGQFSVSFGATAATVTYKGSTSIPANSKIICSFHLSQGGLDDVPSLLAGGPTAPTPGSSIYGSATGSQRYPLKRTGVVIPVRVDLGTPATASSNAIALSQSVSQNAAFVLNGTLVANGVAVMDVPRNVVAAWTTTATITVKGKDEYGNVMVEKSGASTSFTGKKAFATITSITSDTAITSATVGTGKIIGLPVYVDKIDQILEEIRGGTYLGSVTGKVYVQANVPLTDGTYAVAYAPVAGKVTKIQAIVQGVFTTNNAILTFKNNTTSITTGVITELVASVAVGDTYTVTPTAANTFAVGDKIMVVVSGTPGGSKTTQVNVEITPTAFVTDGTFVAGDQTVATATTGDVRGTYQPAVDVDGSTAYAMILALIDPTYLGSAQFAG